MSDLISRSDLLNAFNNKELEIIYKIPVNIDTMRIVNHAISTHKNLVIDIIKNQPKAYDVDKVVKELDKASDYYECEEQGREHIQMVDLTDAIEIVKDGGVSEDCCEKKIDGVNDGWIPVSERLPEPDKYILVSFSNFSLPDIGVYEQKKDGSGTFYPGDENKSYLSFGLMVNAWMPLPDPYKESED